MMDAPQSVAALAEPLGSRARAELALAVARAALPRLEGRPEAEAATRAVETAARCLAGQAAPRDIDDSLHDDQDEGLLVDMQAEADEVRLAPAQAVVTAAAYVSWQASRLAGEPPGSLVSEVGEDTLELLDDYLRQVPGFDWPAAEAIAARLRAAAPPG